MLLSSVSMVVAIAWALFQCKNHLSSYMDSIIKMRWSWDHLIFIIGIPILIRWASLYWDSPLCGHLKIRMPSHHYHYHYGILIMKKRQSHDHLIFIMKWKDCLYVEMGHVLATGHLHPSCWCATTRNGVFSASSSATTINNYHPQWQLLSSWVPVYCHHLLSRQSFSTIPHKEQYCLGGIAINHFIQASICWLNGVKRWIYDQ